MKPIIKTAITDAEILSCWEPIFALRPMLQQENLVNLIKNQQSEGYTLLYIDDQNGVQAIAGYRIFSMLYIGKQLYIDDLSTVSEARGKGYATTLLRHLDEIAIQNNCVTIQLDSGPTRQVAHKLYFNENFTITSFHFGKPLLKK